MPVLTPELYAESRPAHALPTGAAGTARRRIHPVHSHSPATCRRSRSRAFCATRGLPGRDKDGMRTASAEQLFHNARVGRYWSTGWSLPTGSSGCIFSVPVADHAAMPGRCCARTFRCCDALGRRWLACRCGAAAAAVAGLRLRRGSTVGAAARARVYRARPPGRALLHLGAGRADASR